MKALLTIVAVLVLAGCDSKPPSLAEMKRYRLSQLSDDEIRELHKTAEAMAADARANAIKDRDDAAKSRAAFLSQCQDVVLKARNEDQCRPNISDMLRANSGGVVQTASAEGMFDFLLTWSCSSVKSMKEARKLKCMP